jgi:DNA (cytosine-5)-methyltransferase 1
MLKIGNLLTSALNAILNLMTNKHSWLLSDLDKVKKNNFNVFSTFACGGGSSMGYKLAGFSVIGANDIDPQMRRHYEKNLKPKYFIEAPIKKMLEIDLPKELFNLDILDGSPPCSSFSMSGNREKDWGKEKHFREGQSIQVLDDLFFDFLQVADLLKPKVIVAENVKGLIAGNAKGYLKAIISTLNKMGYRPQVFLLNAAFCNVPQRRERVFICAVRNDVSDKKLELNTNNKEISISEATSDLTTPADSYLFPDKKTLWYKYWLETKPGESFQKAYQKYNPGKSGWFTAIKHAPDKPALTIVSGSHHSHWAEPRRFTPAELIRIGSFPDDYWFENRQMPQYLIGMSVPPKMTEVVAKAVLNTWLIKD